MTDTIVFVLRPLMLRYTGYLVRCTVRRRMDSYNVRLPLLNV